ncbi:type I polyketide synthase [Streptomyces noursei]|uniref:type I polyketide synthase n=1 Tax=Streptomyces noursei TaxID=1971 RepID=UPI0033C68D69
MSAEKDTTEDKLRRYLRRTVAELDTATARLRESEERAGEPIAIVGMACRFPGGVDSPDSLWELLAAGGDAITQTPTDRGWDPSVAGGRRGGFLHGAAGFDADFFGISPREALGMDPQQRILLEISWEALERAGYAPTSLSGSATGVFAGVGAVDYGPPPQQAPDEVVGYLGTGTASSVASGRVAYALGLEGVALTVDTACSSSLTAVHLAMASLRRGECELALAGGVSVMSSPGAFAVFRSQGGLAADGRCKPFARAADGFGLAEGAGMLVLQRLSDAQRDSRRVLAVLRGSAVNSDGASNGLTAPNGPSQRRVIQAALDNARLRAHEVDFVEAHGTGTVLGDPIEAHALLETYGADRERPLWLGSVKSNIGHTQAAAGVAGIIKAVLALRHGEIPRTLHLDEPSPHIDWDTGNIALLAEAQPWPRGEQPRRAGVSSFGISGTNAHVIVEESAEPPAAGTDLAGGSPTADAGRADEAGPLVLSARTEEGLRAQARRLADHLAANPGVPLTDVGYTLATCRTPFEHRAVVAGHRAAVLDDLRAVAQGLATDSAPTGIAGAGRRVAMIFPGQGSQWDGMARELLATSPEFAEQIARCEQALTPYVDWSLTDVLAKGVALDRVDVVQPVLFAVMVSLAALWRAHGVEPVAVAGHSQGEIAAAHVAGALSLDDAARLVAVRAAALRRLAGRGGMMSVALSADQAQARIERFGPALSVAAVNGPRGVVVAGEPEALEALRAECEEAGIRARVIPVDYASHSPQVETLRDTLLAELSSVTPQAPRIPFYSATTGERVDDAVLDAQYWYTNLREQVRFERATRLLAEAGCDTFIEVSPQPVLTMSIESTLDSAGTDARVLGTLRRDAGDLRRFHTSLGEAFSHGVDVDWAAVFPSGTAVELPVYPFQHQSFWLPAGSGGARPTPSRDWRYRVVWQERDWGQAPLTGRLLLVDGPGVSCAWAEEITREAERQGAVVVPVRCETPTHDAIVAALRTAGLATDPRDAPTAVVSLLGLGDTEDPSSAALAALELANALGTAGVDAPLWIVTRRAVAVTPDDAAPDPAQAMVCGIGRVVGLEHPERWGGLIDVPEPESALLPSLAAVLAQPGGEEHVAIRPTGRWVPRLVAAPRQAADSGWTPPDTVLVTGGTGGIGAHVARWLAQNGAQHLVLLSRRGRQAPGAKELEQELTDLGVEVTVAACDVADRAQLSAVLDEVRAAGRTVRAVLHTAGVSQSASVEEITHAEFTRVTDAKVRGTVNLDELCPEAEAFVLFSSNAGVWGGPGLGAYAAANAFLDAFAQRRRRLGRQATSVAWGLWAGETMAGEEGSAHLRAQGLRPMDPELAIQQLHDCLADDETCLSVADLDLGTFLDLFTASRRRPLFDELAPARPAEGTGTDTGDRSRLRDELAPLSPPERQQRLTQLVHAEVAAVLGHPDVDRVDPRRAFRDLGLDSVTAVDLRNRLATVTGLRAPATVVFDYPSVVELAQHLAEKLFGGLQSASPVASLPTGDDPDDPIAIVGMACRFPGGVGSPDELWEFVTAGGDAVTEMPDDRGWDLDRLYDPDPDSLGTTYCRHGAFLPDAASFDAAFFGISPREALAMDPQQRQVLETTWELFENAGIDPRSLRGSDTGIFLGAAFQGYGTGADVPDGSAGYVLTGSSSAVVSGRVAYVLGLHGPALTVDTACSSSLVALHTAAKSLRDGDCDLAVAGGVSVMAGPEVFTEFSRQGGLAADGRCKPFSADADGFGFAEGVAVVLLERLSQARRRGHRVLAVVAGSAINSDGASNGLAAPSGRAQERVIRQAWHRAGISGDYVDAVEGHGTGTRLGDPIEAGALGATYGAGRPAERPLWIGSVKSNIGHTQAAAGVAGVIKMVSGLQRGVLPHSLLHGERSPLIDWSGVDVATESRPWAAGAPDGVRRAGVSAFGVSGTNAHVILAEARTPERTEPGAGDLLDALGVVPLPLSAHTPTALTEVARRLESHVGNGTSLEELGLSLATRRAALEHRAVLLAHDHAELRDLLAKVADGEPSPGVVTGVAAAARRAVFVFPGQGSQWTGMAQGLLDTVPVFGQWLAEVDKELSPVVGYSVLAVLRGDPGTPPPDRVDVVQPVLFAVMVCLARLWRLCGVEPSAVVGHSQGEIAAAYVAGALSLRDAARVVGLRARALRALSGHGGMLSVAAGQDRVRGLLAPWADQLCVAAVNSPNAVVVAGEPDALAEAEARCTEAGVRARRIPVDYASHSPQVERIRDRLLADLEDITPQRGDLPVYSTLHGRRLDTAEMDGRYWYDNLRSRVSFDAAIGAAVADGFDTFVEVSPHPVLTTSVTETAERLGGEVLALGTLHRDHAEGHFAGELARAHAAGVSLDWTAVFPAVEPAPLPNYPFEHQRYWLAPDETDRIADWRYRIAWHRLPATASAALSGTYLIVGTGTDPVEHDVARAVGDAGADTYTLTVDPLAAGRDGLAASLREVPGTVDGVISLLAPGNTSDDPRSAAGANLLLHQALDDAELTAPLWLVTREAVTPDDTQATDPEQAMVWGLGLVIGLETPHRWGGLVDLPAVPGPRALGELVAALAGAGDEDQFAVREDGRYVRRLVRASVDRSVESWAPTGTALVTGGTGALGRQVGRYLARRGAEHVVLLSRQGADAPGAAAIQEELGARVSIAACDVTDREQLSAVLAGLREQGRAVRTVVHLAGLPESRPLHEIAPAGLAEVTDAKVIGAQLLDELCPDAEAFVLFSSNAGVWGSGGLGAYAAGNAYLDALAQRRRAEGRPGTSVAWGAWAGGGMAQADLDGLVRRGLRPMQPDHALRALQQALDQRDTCVSVADMNWARFAVGYTANRPRPLLTELLATEANEAETAPVTPGPDRPLADELAGLTPAEAEERVIALVRGHVAAVLGHSTPDAVGLEQPFRDLGFDSLTAVGVRNALQRAAGVSLPTTVVFDHPTVRSVATHLRSLLDVPARTPAEAGDTLRTYYLQSARQGRLQPYLDLLAGLSDFREHFDHGSDTAVKLTDLASGPGPTRLVCCAGTAPTSGPHEFVRLAGALRDRMPVSALSLPGYERDEPLPVSLGAVLDAQARTIQAAYGDEPIMLVGHSAGAMMAYALATELADRGTLPRGVVLVDVYPPERQDAVYAWLSELTSTMFDREYVQMDDTRLTATGAYDRFMRHWRPRDIGVPTLLVRATEPMGQWPDDASWKSTWDFPHVAVDVPGDHFSMIQEHAGEIAERLHDWIHCEGDM